MNRPPASPQVDVLRARQLIAGNGGGAAFPAGTGFVGVSGGAPILANERFPYTTPNLYVDPQNSTGNASDAHPGTSPLAPLLTTAAVNAKLFMRDVQVNAVVTYLSDDTVSGLLDLSTTTCLDYINHSLTFQGMPHILRSGHTLSAVTASVPASNTRASIADSGFNFSGLLHNLVVITSGPRTGNAAWLASGTTAPDISPPMDPLGDALATFSVGDAYEIHSGSVLTLAPSGPFLGSLRFNDFAFTTASLGPTGDQSANAFVQYNRCSFSSFLPVAGIYTNCYCAQGMQMTGVPFVVGGIFVSTHFDVCYPTAQFDGECYITGFGLVVGPTNYQGLTLNASIGTGPQFQDTTGPAALQAWENVDFGNAPGGGTTALIWGNGNAGLGVLVGPGITVRVAAANMPVVTGAAGADFGFVPPQAGVAVTAARAVAADNTVSASVSTTWANLAGGTLNFQAQYFPGNAAVVGVSGVF